MFNPHTVQRVGLSFLFILTMFDFGGFALAQTPSWPTIEGKGFRGVIMDPDTALLSWRANQNAPATQGFVPTEGTLRQLEAKLKPAIDTSKAARIEQLQGHDLTTYVRRYGGVMVDGKRKVVVEAACRNHDAFLDNTPMRVSDGGACYFEAVYDVDSARFVSFYVHGEA